MASSSVLFHRPEGTSDTKALDKKARDEVFTISVIVSCMEGLLLIWGLRMYLPSSRESGHLSPTLECLEMKVLIPELRSGPGSLGSGNCFPGPECV